MLLCFSIENDNQTHYIYNDENNNVFFYNNTADEEGATQILTNTKYFVYKNKLYFYENDIFKIYNKIYNNDLDNEDVFENQKKIENVDQMLILANKSIIFISDNKLQMVSSSNNYNSEELIPEQSIDKSFIKFSNKDNICFLNKTKTNIVEIIDLNNKRFNYFSVNSTPKIKNFEICNNIAYVLYENNKLVYEGGSSVIDEVNQIALFNDQIYYVKVKKDKYEIHNLHENKMIEDFDREINTEINLQSTGDRLVIIVKLKDEYILFLLKNKKKKLLDFEEFDIVIHADKDKNKISITFYIFLAITMCMIVSLIIRYILYFKKIKKKK